MTRTLITILLPLATPFVLYFAWSWYVRQSGLAKDAEDGGGVPAPPWAWLAVAGIAFAALVLIATILLGIDGEEGTYHPPRFEDGRIVPGRIEPGRNER